VVLIDEVDKAPRDFPNDILNEIQRMFFRIPEIRESNGQGMRTVQADPGLRPVVVITSNSEKNLPGAFRRRCVFHHIRFPERKFKERMRDIVSANLGQAVGALANSAMDFFYDVREQLSLEKAPSTAELVQWIRLLQSRQWQGLNGHPGNVGLGNLPVQELTATLGVLAKTADDLAKLQSLAQQRFSKSKG
jgi:MoxR-like ATPase